MELNRRAKTKWINDALSIMTVPSDVMTEIFIRLPDCRSALRCAAVCKEWLSLVIDPRFGFRFNDHHNQLLNNNKGKLPSEILFRTNTRFCIKQPVPPLSLDYFSPPDRCSKEETSSYLSFLPGWPSVTVLSSSGDLLLVELLVELYDNRNENRRLCVCNPLTKHWITLPDPPPAPHSKSYHGFTTQASSSLSSLKYRVVVMSSELYTSPGVHLAVFRSETGRWDQSYRWFQIDYLHQQQHKVLSFHITSITTVGRFTYLPVISGYRDQLCNLAVIDTFSESFSFRLLELPQTGFGLRTWRCSYDRVCVGVVRGRLRICQYHYWYVTKDLFMVKIWELKEYDYDNNVASWVFVKKAKVENVKAKFKWLCVRAFHPQDDEVLFVADSGQIDIVWKYHISRGRLEKLGEVIGITSSSECCNVHAVVHPPWPTRIPNTLSF